MKKYALILFALVCSNSSDISIVLHENDAVVWHPEQEITGELSGFTTEQVTVHQDDSSFAIRLADNRFFSFPVVLRNQETKIWIETPHKKSIVISDTLDYTLGYDPVPILKPVASVSGDKAVLRATILENPYQTPLKYNWTPDPVNPARSRVSNEEDPVATATIPDEPGDYYFNLLVVAGQDSVRFKTMVTRESDGLRAFNIDTDYPGWMNKAVIYQISPAFFVEDGTFGDITAKLPELKHLGINTIWLQPVTLPYRTKGQGYGVVDYLSVNPNLGTEKQLRHLIASAKDLGIRVLFDVVLNHTSIHHPYAKDRMKHGTKSHYHDYYQHETDGKPYSSYYTKDEHGFINYFWDELVNLNYNNKEVRRWMLEVCKYWVREFDIDGYRFDAIWGVNARNPSFSRRLRTELKSIKPEVLLLAEDKGSVPEVFEIGFDAAYDWMPDTGWVSHWSWEYDYDERKSLTIFNYQDVNRRGAMLRKALFQNGGNDYRKLRFIENNDLERFIVSHQLKRTKMAAALLLGLPGIPMLYNGQEIGFREHPYTARPVFHADRSIQSLDDKGLFRYYQKLIRIRREYPALHYTTMREIPVFPEAAAVAFHRWNGDENVIVVINMDSTSSDVYIDTRNIAGMPSPLSKYRLQDVLSDKTFEIKQDLPRIKIRMEGHSARWLLLKNKVL